MDTSEVDLAGATPIVSASPEVRAEDPIAIFTGFIESEVAFSRLIGNPRDLSIEGKARMSAIIKSRLDRGAQWTGDISQDIHTLVVASQTFISQSGDIKLFVTRSDVNEANGAEPAKSAAAWFLRNNRSAIYDPFTNEVGVDAVQIKTAPVGSVYLKPDRVIANMRNSHNPSAFLKAFCSAVEISFDLGARIDAQRHKSRF